MAAAKKTAKKGRKSSSGGAKKQFLATMDADILRRIKVAAAGRDMNASAVLEAAAAEWLARHEGGK